LTLGSIENALIASAYRLMHGSGELPTDVVPEMLSEALSQALQDTCGLYGLNDEQTARFLMSFALRLGRLRQSLLERNESTELEHQLMEACGLLCPLTLRPEG
jgi:hypothetical protein